MSHASGHLNDLDEVTAALYVSEERYRLLVENAWDVIWTMAVDGTITYVSPSVQRVRGITPAEAAAQTLDQIHPPESAAKVAAYFGELAAAMAAGAVPPVYRGEHEYYRQDGSIMIGALQVIPQCDANGHVIAILGVTRDISAQREYEANLRAARDEARTSEEHFRLLAENASDVVVLHDSAGRISWVSPSLADVLGWEQTDWLDRKISVFVHPDDQADWEQVQNQAVAGAEPITRVTVRFAQASATWRWMSAAIRIPAGESGTATAVVSALRDVQDEVQAQQRLSYLASHDDMTGLVNRAELLRRLSLVLRAAPRMDAGATSQFALLFCDLDNLKGINDQYGHAAGDQVIIELAARIRSQVGGNDVVARIGGDEFVVLLPEVHDPDAAQQVAAAIQDVVTEPVTLAGAEIGFSLSIGLAHSQPGDTPDQLLARADRLLYSAKQAGRNRTVSGA